MILDSVARGRREAKRLAYLAASDRGWQRRNPAPRGTGGTLPSRKENNAA
jgi:hypothetical protein